MRLVKLLIVCGVLAYILTATTFAQGSAPAEMRQPASVRNAAYNDTYLNFAPSDNEPPAPGAAADKEKKTEAAAEEEKKDEAAPEEEKAPEPKRLIGQVGCSKLNVTGWIEAGGYPNQYGASSNGPLGTVDQPAFNLNQLWMTVERATSTEKEDWDFGGRMDYMYGVDGPDTQCFGDHSFDFNWTSSFAHNGAALYGSAMPQLYGEVAYRDWKVKIGHFYTPMGNEVFPATGNFFFSHSYEFYYAEPFTHTGMLATRKFSDKLSGSAGWADGWDSGFGDNNHGSIFLGGLTYTPCDKTTVAWYMCSGYWGDGQAFQGASTNDIFMSSLVVTRKLTDKWTYIFQNDYATNYNRADCNSWYGVNQYLTYQINNCWSWGGRIEWFRDDDGVRVTSANETASGISGFAGNFYEMTGGINYKPNANLLIRPEIRYDWYDGLAGAAL